MNNDHFPTEHAKMAYIFGRTTGDSQGYLKSKYGTDVDDPFQTTQEMIKHLDGIYVDPYKVQNARQEYRRLNMKPTQAFVEFYSEFLRLAGRAKIP